MDLYGFVLGTNHSLCKVEISAVLKSKKINFEIVTASAEILIIQAEKIPSINDFGSTAKIVRFYKDLNEIAADIPSTTKNLTYGLSVYHGGGKFKQLNQLWHEAPQIAREMKEILQKHGIKSGFLPLKERILSTVSVKENLLKTGGFELVLIAGPDQTYFGKTLAVQPYEEYSRRDYGRPARDSRTGLTPPKIAKMMVNLAALPYDAKILDPFCGSGTILQEAILLGYNQVFGSDKDIRAITNCRQNLHWQFPNIKINLRSIDALKLSQFYRNLDAIITEPYLGSPKLRIMRRDQVLKERENLENFYLEVLNEFKKILKPGGIIVMILPVIRYKNEFFYLDILDKVKFKQQKYCDYQEKLGLNLTNRGTIVYYRPGQTVSREIIIWK